MDVVAGQPVGAGSEISVLVYNISPDDYIKNGITGGLIILVNQSDATNIQLMYDVTNSSGWANFSYDSNANGCTNYWFIFCPLTDAVNPGEAREMCLNGTKIPASVIGGTMQPEYPPSPNPTSHGCVGRLTKNTCLCGSGGTSYASAQAKPSTGTEFAVPQPSASGGSPLTAAGFFSPDTSPDPLNNRQYSANCQWQAWLYGMCNIAPDDASCAPNLGPSCNSIPGCFWDQSTVNASPFSGHCRSWKYLCNNCSAAVSHPAVCSSLMNSDACSSNPACMWVSGSCMVSDMCTGVNYAPPLWGAMQCAKTTVTCCLNGTCAASCAGVGNMPSNVYPYTSGTYNFCNGNSCQLNCWSGAMQCPLNPNICVSDVGQCCDANKIRCPICHGSNCPSDEGTCQAVCHCPFGQVHSSNGIDCVSPASCGTPGMPCCSSLPLPCGDPNQGLFCNASENSPTGVCRSCGATGQVCCPSTSPGGQSFCTSSSLNCMSGICTSCASPNYLCLGACTTPVCQWTGTDTAGACGEISTAGNTPGYMAPLNPNTSYYLPSTNQFYICNQKPSTYTNLCWPVMLIVSLLIGASFLAGKNPFMAFDFSSPRMGRGKQYTMRNQNKSFDITAAVMVGADKATETASGGGPGIISKLSGFVQGTVGTAAEAVFGTSNATKDKSETAVSNVVPNANAKPVVPVSGDGDGRVTMTNRVVGNQTQMANQTAPDLRMTAAAGVPSLFDKLGGAFSKLGSLGTIEKGSAAESLFKGSKDANGNVKGPSAGEVRSRLFQNLLGKLSDFASGITSIFSKMFSTGKRREGYGDDGNAKTGAWETAKDVGSGVERFLKGVIDLYSTFKGLSDMVRQYKGLAKGLGLSHMSARESQRGIGFFENIDQKASGMTILGREMSIGEMVRMADADPTSYAGPLSILRPAAETLRDKAELDSEAPGEIPLIGKKVMTKDGQKVFITAEGHVLDEDHNELFGDKKEKVLDDGYVKLVVGEMHTGTPSGVKSEIGFFLVGKDGKGVETDFIGYRAAQINQAHHDDLAAKVQQNSRVASAEGFGRLDKVVLPLLILPLALAEAPVAVVTGGQAMKTLKNKLRAYAQSDEFAFSQLFVSLDLNTVDEKSKAKIADLKERFEKNLLTPDEISKIQRALGKERSGKEIIDGLSKLENSDISKYREYTLRVAGGVPQNLDNSIAIRQDMVAVTNSSLMAMSGKSSVDKDTFEMLSNNQGAYLSLLYTENQGTQALQNIVSGERDMGHYMRGVMTRSKAENEKHLADNNQLISDYEKAKTLNDSDPEKKKLEEADAKLNPQGLPVEALKLDNALLAGAIGATPQEREGVVMANDFFLKYQQQIFDDYSSQAKWIFAAWKSGEDRSKLTQGSNSLDKTIQNIKKPTLYATMSAQMELSAQRESIFNSEASKFATKATVSGGLSSPALQKDGGMRAVAEEMGQKSDKLSDLAAERMTALVEGKASESADKKYALASQEFSTKYNAGGSAFERGNADAAIYLLNQTKGNLAVASGNKTFEVDLGKVDVGKDSEYKKNELAMDIVHVQQLDYLISKTDYSDSPRDDGTLQMNAKKAIAYADMRADELVDGSITKKNLDAAVGLLGGSSGWASKLESQEMRVFDSSSAGVQIRLNAILAQWEASHGPFGSDYLEDAYSKAVDQARGATETNKPYSLLYDTLFGAPGGYDQFQLEKFELPLEQIDYTPKVPQFQLPRASIPDIGMPAQETKSSESIIVTRAYVQHLNKAGREEISNVADETVVGLKQSHVQSALADPNKEVHIKVGVPIEYHSKDAQDYNYNRLGPAIQKEIEDRVSKAGISGIKVEVDYYRPTLTGLVKDGIVNEGNWKAVQKELSNITNENGKPISGDLKLEGYDVSSLKKAKSYGEFTNGLLEAGTYHHGDIYFKDPREASDTLLRVKRGVSIEISDKKEKSK